MAGQSYNFTFQNQNPTSGWTGPSLAQTAASLYDTPFDPVDPNQAIQDTTENNPEGIAGTTVAITSAAQGQAMLKRQASLLKNLEKQAKKVSDAESLGFLNEQITNAQKEQIRIQNEITKFGGSIKTKGGKNEGGGGAGATVNDTQWAAAAAQNELTKKLTQGHTQIDKQQDKLNAHTASIDSLKAAIASTTDAKVLDHLNKQLAKEQEKFSKEQAKVQSQTAHLTELQGRLTAINPPATTPPVTTTPGPVTGTTSTAPVAGVTINPKTGVAWTAQEIADAAAHPGQANYFNDLVDKTLASRAGVSGWHSVGGALPPPVVTPPVVTPPVVTPPVVTPPVVVPGAPAVPRALTPQEIKWRAKFDPRGWANSAGILSPAAVTPVTPVLNAKQQKKANKISGWT